MATPQVQTVQRSPLEDLQKWMPIIQTMLANKSANKLAQKNEMGQLLQLKMKQMESGYTEEDQKQLELMQNNYHRMKGSYNLTDSIKSILGLEKPPDTTPMLALSRLANPPSSMQAQGTLPNVPEMGEKPSPQDVVPSESTGMSINPDRYKANYETILNLQRENLTRGGQPIIGGKPYNEALTKARDKALELEMKNVPSYAEGRPRKQTQEWAETLYGKPFQSLAPQEKRRVLETSASYESQFRAAGGIEAGLDKPLSDNDLQSWINPTTLAPYPAGTTMRDVRASGAIAVTSKQKEELRSMDNVAAIVESIGGLADRIITAENAGEALAKGPVLYAGAMTKTNPSAAAYSDMRAQFLGVLARSLGGERGVLTDMDINRVMNGLPKFNDTKAIKDFKLGVLKNLMDTSIQSKKAIMLGGSVDRREYRQNLNNMLDILEGKASPGREQTSGRRPGVY
uniref:Uncharacterized protein n=1 Tax=viral metagenome TaxID=1070528 RepID=A0A6M3LFI0_9ZZZZ